MTDSTWMLPLDISHWITGWDRHHAGRQTHVHKLGVQPLMLLAACRERLHRSAAHLTWPGDSIGECCFLADLACSLGPENMMLSAASRVRWAASAAMRLPTRL